MSNNINCPNCAFAIDVDGLVAANLDKKYKEENNKIVAEHRARFEKEKEALEEKERLFEEKRQKENEIFKQKMEAQRTKWQEEKNIETEKLKIEFEENARKKIAGDFENKMKILEENSKDTEEKLKTSREKELLWMKKERELNAKAEEMEVNLQRKLMAEREVLKEEIYKTESNKSAAKMAEIELKLQEQLIQNDSKNKLIDELQRKAQQGSMQLQGEAQEILLEKLLRENYPFDLVEEVGKGVGGADCTLTIRNGSGIECGKIIFESKRTKAWNKEWLEKLKKDMRSCKADIAVLVTETFPRDMQRFGDVDGVWVCNFSEVISLCAILRSGVLNLYDAKQSQEGKSGKMQMLYDYLTGNEFSGQVEAIAEGFLAMNNSIAKERMQMEKMWKERERQLQKVLLNTSGLYGSVKGIAGGSVGHIALLEGDEVDS